MVFKLNEMDITKDHLFKIKDRVMENTYGIMVLKNIQDNGKMEKKMEMVSGKI
jgi:hypothetical protein